MIKLIIHAELQDTHESGQCLDSTNVNILIFNIRLKAFYFSWRLVICILLKKKLIVGVGLLRHLLC